MKKCLSCDTKYSASEKLCPKCGSSESIFVCDKCGTSFTSKYCPECGTKAVSPPKTCPQCGLEYTSPACPNCGYNEKEKDIIESKEGYEDDYDNYEDDYDNDNNVTVVYHKQLIEDTSLAKGNVFDDASILGFHFNLNWMLSSIWFLVLQLALTPLLSIYTIWRYHGNMHLIVKILLTILALFIARMRYSGLFKG